MADPRAPSIVSKRNELALRDKRLNLRPERRCFCRSKVIVDDEPAAITQQVAVAIQISADVIVRVENEQAYVVAPQAQTNLMDTCLVEGTAGNQGNLFRDAEPGQVLFQVFDDVPARQSDMLYAPSGLNRDDFFCVADSGAPNAAAIVDPPI